MSSPLRVLIVDDSEDDALLVARTLRRSGYELTFSRVDTAEAMRDALHQQPWDVIIADYSMPRFSGLDALALCEEMGFDLPFILASGTIGEEIAVDAMKAGAHDYVMKGHLARLVPAVARELREAQVRQARRQAEQSLQQRAEELDKLNALIRKVSASLSPDQVVEAALAGVATAIVPDMVLLYLRQGDDFRLQGVYPDTPEGQLSHVEKVAECLCGGTIDAGEPIYVSDLSRDSRCTLSSSHLAGIQAFATLPLLEGTNVLGVLGVASMTVRDFSKQTAFLQALTAEIAVGLQNALLYQQVQHHAIDLEREIVQRRQAEDAHRESEERFRNIFENSPIGIYQTTPDGRVLMANPTLVRMLGYDSFAEVAQRDLAQEPYFALYSRENFKQRVEREGQIIGLEAAWTKKDGSLLLIRENARVVRDAQGSVLYYEGTAEDITERVRVEREREQLLKEVQEQAQQIRRIIDTVPEGVLLLDGQNRIILINPAGQRDLKILTNAGEGDILESLGDRPLSEFLTWSEERLWHEIEIDGRMFEVIARPIQTISESPQWLLVVRDMTQQRKIEERANRHQQLAAVGQLAAGIAHDFNNILAVIMLYSQMALRSPDASDKLQERLTVVFQQGRRASELINQILDFSRSAPLDLRPLDLVPLLKEQIKLWERTLPENISIDWVYDLEAYYVVNGDPTRIRQMLMNLVVNARDAMPTGGALRIWLERMQFDAGEKLPLPELHAGDWIRVSVLDTGTGIPDDVLPHIYEPFYTTKTPDKGTGLGLAQVFGIVVQHEGTIDVKTKVGEGTTFVVYLPALTISTNAVSAVEVGDLPPGHGETILIIEDNAELRITLVQSLTQLNYRILEAGQGEEALRLLERHSDEVDLVLSDWVMPGMAGQALVQALQMRNPSIPIVVLTGHPLTQVEGELQEAGVVAWLQKPQSLEQLARSVDEALSGWRP